MILVNNNAKNTKYTVSYINLSGSHYDIELPITPDVINVIIQLIKL